MKARPASSPPEATRFRLRLFGALLALVAGFGAVGLTVARRGIAADEERSFEREFQGGLATLHHVQELRHAALLERCRALARRPRIHAALEDGALDLLYLSARDELRDAVAPSGEPLPEGPAYSLRARFYRFLDENGDVLAPPADDDACGELSPGEDRQIHLPGIIDHPQTGYITGPAGTREISEIIATPIISSETGAPIAALVLGFEPVRLTTQSDTLPGFASGIWTGSALSLPNLAPAARDSLLAALARSASPATSAPAPGRERLTIDGAPHLVFFKQLNPDSRFPAGYEVCVFPLTEMQARQRRATWRILGLGGVLLFGGFVASHHLAARFARPVAALAHDSREQRTQRQRAEAELQSTSAELERVARFSADASHQLKTPVTVLRAGLDEILARGAIPAAEVEEVSALIHQTYRLSTIIDDLLLLSRMDAGQLKIRFADVDLGLLIAAALDDLSASPDELELAVDSDCPPSLRVAGEKRYIAVILQNLLENARKYNRPGGRIQITARSADGHAIVSIGNTTQRPIPLEAQSHIFERFHRAAMGENIPGYGIGLNLARELARLHDGDLRLLRSDETWTEFEVRFRALPSAPATA